MEGPPFSADLTKASETAGVSTLEVEATFAPVTSCLAGSTVGSVVLAGSVIGIPARLLSVSARVNEFLPDTQQIGLGVVVGQTGWEQVLENNKNLFAADFVGRSHICADAVLWLSAP
ncbi:MAG: hypothetical protein H0V18_05435 [Pyrinomonadaceae bacterium]|nr:hypothetical protein [Pyrinomonadaceae bacterium]